MRNPYAALMALLPDRPLLIGTVSSVADGVCTITVPGGGITTARGDLYAVGDKVFFRDGAIEGTAPDLPVEIIEV